MRLKKYNGNPIMKPNPMNLWEAKYIFNPGVIYDGEIFHMIYRAQGPDMVSRFGYAVSKDGIKFNRLSEPVFEPENMDEIYGVEDARITYIDNKFHVTYTAFAPGKISIGLATTTNFIRWKREGTLLENFEKDAVIFPEKINGKYAMIYSIEPDMYISYSKDKLKWSKPKKIASPRNDKWDNVAIGIGGIPIKTKEGWLITYHGVENGIKAIYKMGLMLLDLKNPSKLLKRSDEPILEPEMSWEIAGGIPNIVFSTAMVEVEDKFYMYYGGADSSIGVATIDRQEIYDWIKTE
jgi:predicted GH43/DUF377 family glycosyl hydrolase